MPKKPSISQEKLIAAIKCKREEIFDFNTSKIWGPSHICWKSIAQDLNNVISSKYIYTVVLENRFEILKHLDFPKNSFQAQIGVYSTLSSSSDNDDEPNIQTLEFSITLSAEEWKLVYDSERKFYKRTDRGEGVRAYDVLIPYQWTTIIHEHFFDLTKKPCPISYKYAKVFPMGHIYLKIFGQCTKCQSVLKGVVHNLPESNSRVLIKCSYSGSFDSCVSGFKRRIIGKKRDYYSDKLIQQNMSASYI